MVKSLKDRGSRITARKSGSITALGGLHFSRAALHPQSVPLPSGWSSVGGALVAKFGKTSVVRDLFRFDWSRGQKADAVDERSCEQKSPACN